MVGFDQFGPDALEKQMVLGKELVSASRWLLCAVIIFSSALISFGIKFVSLFVADVDVKMVFQMRLHEIVPLVVFFKRVFC